MFTASSDRSRTANLAMAWTGLPRPWMSTSDWQEKGETLAALQPARREAGRKREGGNAGAQARVCGFLSKRHARILGRDRAARAAASDAPPARHSKEIARRTRVRLQAHALAKNLFAVAVTGARL